MNSTDVIFILSLCVVAVVFLVGILQPYWYGLRFTKFGRWWKYRNKTLKDYDIRTTLIVPTMHGLLDSEYTVKIEFTAYRREHLDEKLLVAQVSNKIQKYLDRRYHLADEVFKRNIRRAQSESKQHKRCIRCSDKKFEIEPQLEILTYKYGGTD